MKQSINKCNILNHSGKPVAVTHCKSQGRKEPIPGSDIEYEQKMWRSKKDKGKSTNPDQPANPDSSTCGFGRKGNLDAFSSMSEIASCSYEARQVRFITNKGGKWNSAVVLHK